MVNMNNAFIIIESCLTNRKQLVKKEENMSHLIDIDLGLSQGSFLGLLPFLFILMICLYLYQITSFVYLLMTLLCY